MEFTVGLAAVTLVIGGIMWFNVSPVWTYLFAGPPDIANQTFLADENQVDATTEEDTVDKVSNLDSLQTMFLMAYIVLGAGLTAFAIFVSAANFLLHRRQGTSIFTVSATQSPP